MIKNNTQYPIHVGYHAPNREIGYWADLNESSIGKVLKVQNPATYGWEAISGGSSSTPTLQDVVESGNTSTISINVPDGTEDSHTVNLGQLNTALSQIELFVIVTELPVEGQPNLLYLVPKQSTEQNNIFDEYVWVGIDAEHPNGYEAVGTIHIDLSNYLSLAGGTMNGGIITTFILPKSDDTYSLGVSSSAYKNGYINNLISNTLSLNGIDVTESILGIPDMEEVWAQAFNDQEARKMDKSGMPSEILLPFGTVERTATDATLKGSKLTWNIGTEAYDSTSWEVVIPGANGSQAGLMSSDQFNLVDTINKRAFGIKFAVSGLNQNISTGSVLNLVSFLNLTNTVVTADDRTVSEYSIVNPGTTNALLRLPNILTRCNYNIEIRATGTIGGSATQTRTFFVEIHRSNDTVTSFETIRIPANSDIGRAKSDFTTYTSNSSDEYITNGFKLVVNNPSTGSSDITLTGVEIIINGNA